MATIGPAFKPKFRAPNNPRANLRDVGRLNDPDKHSFWTASNFNHDPIPRAHRNGPMRDDDLGKDSRHVREVVDQYGSRMRYAGIGNHRTSMVPKRISSGTRAPGVIHPVHERPVEFLPSQSNRTYYWTQDLTHNAHDAVGGPINNQDMGHTFREFNQYEGMVDRMPDFFRSEAQAPSRDQTQIVQHAERKVVLAPANKVGGLVHRIFKKGGADRNIQDTKHTRKEESIELRGAPRHDATIAAIQVAIPPRLPLSASIRSRKTEEIDPRFRRVQTHYEEASDGVHLPQNASNRVRNHEEIDPRFRRIQTHYEEPSDGVHLPQNASNRVRNHEEIDPRFRKAPTYQEERANGSAHLSQVLQRSDMANRVFQTTGARGANTEHTTEHRIGTQVRRAQSPMMLHPDNEAVAGRGMVDTGPGGNVGSGAGQIVFGHSRKTPVNARYVQSTVRGSAHPVAGQYHARDDNKVYSNLPARQTAQSQYKGSSLVGLQTHRLVQRKDMNRVVRNAVPPRETSVGVGKYVGQQTRGKKVRM